MEKTEKNKVEEKSEMDDKSAYLILSLGGIGISIGLLPILLMTKPHK